MLEKIHKEYNFSLIEHKLINEKLYIKRPIKNITMNCMIKDAYEWSNETLIDLICKTDSSAYLYLLKRLIMLKHNNKFIYYFNKYNVDWTNSLEGLQWLLFPCIKAGNNKIAQYLMDKFPQIDLFYNCRYIDYICSLEDIDLYPRADLVSFFSQHIDLSKINANMHSEFNVDITKMNMYTLETICRYEGCNTPSSRFIYCIWLKRKFEQNKRFTQEWNEIMKKGIYK